MFIICIGLLSVLMVIPYGAFQVAQARNAEYISNMLDAGAEDLQIMGWDKNITSKEGVGIPSFIDDSIIEIYLIDPFVNNDGGSFFKSLFTSPPFNNPTIIETFQERMTGSDDLKYILSENARTKINTEGLTDPTTPQSSGQYTYFITIKPQEIFSNEFVDNGNTIKEFTNVKFTTDLLGCYQRVESYTTLNPSDFSWRSYLKSAEITITNNTKRLDFSTTKYVLVTWETPQETDNSSGSTPINLSLRRGEWCKIVNVINNNADNQVVTIVSNDVVSIKNNATELNQQNMNNMTIIVFPGVMYHKRIYD
jgi:hypothetical protein